MKLFGGRKDKEVQAQPQQPQYHSHTVMQLNVESMGTQELGELLHKVGSELASRGAHFCVSN